MLLAAVVAGLSSAWKNPTAAALVLAYIASQFFELPPKLYILPDILTLAMIFSKPRYHPCDPYYTLSTWQQLKCIWTERSPADRLIITSMPLAWYFYAPVLTYHQYWALWWIAIFQFAVVSIESVFISWCRHRHRDGPGATECPRNWMEVSVA